MTVNKYKVFIFVANKFKKKIITNIKVYMMGVTSPSYA